MVMVVVVFISLWHMMQLDHKDMMNISILEHFKINNKERWRGYK
jgi:hypothetical protein